MKNYIILISFFLGLTACGGQSNDDSENGNITQFSVSLTANENGSFSPSNIQQIDIETDLPFEYVITPDTGWKIKTVSGCGGNLVDSTFTLNSLASDCTIVASFERKTFTVEVEAQEHGLISPDTSQSILFEEMVAFTITADSGYEIDEVTGCEGTLEDDIYTTGAIEADCTVNASFIEQAADIQYSVSLDVGDNGHVELMGVAITEAQSVDAGDTLNLEIAPDNGYIIDTITGCTGQLQDFIYETSALTEKCTVNVRFKATEMFTIVPVASTGGTILPSETQIVPRNQLVQFEIQINSDGNYVLLDVDGCEGELDGNIYTTAAITEHCNVIAEFAQHSILNDTGMIRCGNYDEEETDFLKAEFESNLDCAAQPSAATESQSGVDSKGHVVAGGQDAHFGRDAIHQASLLSKVGDGEAGFDFTRLNNDGTEYSGSGDYSTEPWVCVQDNHTGLIWEVKEANDGEQGDSARDGDDRFSWYQPSQNNSTNGGWPGPVDRPNTSCYGQGQTVSEDSNTCTTFGYATRINNQMLCGIDTWRLPSVTELNGLVNYGKENHISGVTTLIDANYFPNTDSSRLYWTGNAANHFSSSNEAWAADFGAGVTLLQTKSSLSLVRLVADVNSDDVPEEYFTTQKQKAEAYSIFRNDFIPIAKNEKCINCHEFVIENEIYQTHIDQSRITPQYKDSDCAGCHTAATGFVDGWRPPLPGVSAQNFLMQDSTPSVICNAMNRLRDPAHHLLEDALILWAIDQIPEVLLEDWRDLVNSMQVEGTTDVFSCQQPL